MSRNFLSKNDELRKGDYLMSNNGEFKAIFQGDGNFVVYGWQPVWASDTAGPKPLRLCMQGDCNLVMYGDDEKPMWHTNSSKSDCVMCRLQLTDEGKLVVNNGAHEVFNSANSSGMK
ncbi:B-type lectin plumieribetin-like [Eleginops maclovinus]|uniref:B-type lectin plumieribetin-like n=1 Tax=Eleginops maclovinus TaxID=56733 RepID=UPI003080822B